jgi:hypothetical protein
MVFLGLENLAFLATVVVLSKLHTFFDKVQPYKCG